jgi:hypothetical protein
VKYTQERRIPVYDSYAKKQPINRVKEDFVVSVLVFVFQLHKNTELVKSALNRDYLRQDTVDGMLRSRA